MWKYIWEKRRRLSTTTPQLWPEVWEAPNEKTPNGKISFLDGPSTRPPPPPWQFYIALPTLAKGHIDQRCMLGIFTIRK